MNHKPSTQSEDRRNPKKTVWIFAIASFLNDFGSDIIYPVWPIFLTTVLGANMAIVGLIDGIGDAVVSIMKAVSGYWSDRIAKRKVFIWSGYIFGAVSRIGYALSTTWHHIIPFRILDRSGKIRSAPRDAMIADVSTQSNRALHFGVIRMMDNLGAVFGIITCILLIDTLGYRKLFMFAAIPSVIGAIIIMMYIKEHNETDNRLFKGFTFKDLDANFKLFTVSSALFALGAFSYSFLLIYAKKYVSSVQFIPIFYLIFTAVASISSIPMGKLADMMGRKFVLFISFACWALVSIIIIFFDSLAAMIMMFVCYGLHKGALEPVQKAFVAELSQDRYRASSMGTFQMIIGLCALPSSLIAGILWEGMSKYAPFYFSLILTALSIGLLLLVKEKQLAEHSRQSSER
ncbi:MFS transporter [candidate division KSB1 bacterium]|nr:MFS transporter [candidate division KSB1 bacterium]